MKRPKIISYKTYAIFECRRSTYRFSKETEKEINAIKKEIKILNKALNKLFDDNNKEVGK